MSASSNTNEKKKKSSSSKKRKGGRNTTLLAVAATVAGVAVFLGARRAKGETSTPTEPPVVGPVVTDPDSPTEPTVPIDQECPTCDYSGYTLSTLCMDKETCTQEAREGYTLNEKCLDEDECTKDARIGYTESSLCKTDVTAEDCATHVDAGREGYILPTECVVDETEWVRKSVVDAKYILKENAHDTLESTIREKDTALAIGLGLPAGLTLVILITAALYLSNYI